METTRNDTIFDFIKTQEAMYRRPIPLNNKWNWSMYDHIELSTLYKHSQLSTGKHDFKPVKNIIRPILNLEYRTEDIDVRDVQLYVDDPKKYHLSFLVKKYHDDVFTIENDMDTFFDELNVSRIDYGGGLSKKLYKPRPEVVPLESIVFCDQTDMLSGPIGIKHYYSPDQLLEMGDKGWGSKTNGATASLEETISLSREYKKDDKNGTIAETPGRYIEVYEVHGNLPKKFVNQYNVSGKYETRLFIVCFYQPKGKQEKEGIILYTALEKESPFKLIKRDSIFGRALGFGGAEELFEAQVWVNYDMIRMQDMLDAAAKTIMITQDSTLVSKHPTGLKDMENMEFIEEGVNGNTRQLDTFPRNVRLFERSIEQWEAHAQQMGAANDALMGKSPASGTPFALQELVVQTSQGLHDYRRGQYAKHLEEIYKDWIIPHIIKKICEGSTFLSELSLEELQYVTEAVVECESQKMVKEKMLRGELIYPDEIEQHRQMVRELFKKRGNKHFIKILKGEFKGISLGVKVSIAGKSKNLAQLVDKLVNVFRTIMTNPAILQNKAMAGLWNQIIEASGLDPVDFSDFQAAPRQGEVAQPIQQQPSPMQPQPAQPSY